MSKHNDLLPCPVCGAEPQEGALNGKHVIYCDDHLFANASGATRAEAAKKWNTQTWGKTMTHEETEELENEDDDS